MKDKNPLSAAPSNEPCLASAAVAKADAFVSRASFGRKQAPAPTLARVSQALSLEDGQRRGEKGRPSLLQGMASAAPNVPWMVGMGRTEAKTPRSLWGGIRAQPAYTL